MMGDIIQFPRKKKTTQEVSMPVVTKVEHAEEKGKKSVGRLPKRTKGEMGAKFPPQPKSSDKQYEGTIGGQSKRLPQI